MAPGGAFILPCVKTNAKITVIFNRYLFNNSYGYMYNVDEFDTSIIVCVSFVLKEAALTSFESKLFTFTAI